MSLYNDTTLFTTLPPRTVRYDLPDATLTLFEGFIQKPESDDLYTALLQETEWKQEDITVYNKTYPTPLLPRIYCI